MIIRNKYNGYSADGVRLYPLGGGGNSGPTQSTVTQSNIPEWLRPQVETVLGGATKQLFQTNEIPGVADPETGVVGPSTFDVTGTKAFVPYSANAQDYVAGFSPLQQQVQANAANLQVPGQYGQATDMASAAGMGGMQSAQNANMYGAQGAQSGMQGQQIGTQGGQYYGGMGVNYGNQGAQFGLQGGQLFGGQGAGYGAQAAGLSPQAQNYGQTAADIGQMALQAQDYGQQIGSQAQNYASQAAGAGQQYAQQATSPGAMQQYMSPYMQNVIDVQNQAAQRQADIASTQRGSAAARSGAFGGARQAIENAEAQKNLATLQNTNQAQGLQQAYQQAQQAQQFGANLGLQGLSGAQQGLGTALQGGQLGLSGIGQAMAGQQAGLQGLSTANQLYGTGIQGAGMGLQGVQTGLQGTAQGMQGAGIGLSGVDRSLAGTAQGMQGAQVGLQGVSGAQAGYGLTNQAASNMANIGTQQLAAQTGILGLQNQIGAQQQAQEQAITNNAINNYAQAQQAPMTALEQYNALLRGYAMPGSTTATYQAAPSAVSQLAGLGTAAVGLSKLAGAAGGRPRNFKKTKASGLDTLGLYNAMNQ